MPDKNSFLRAALAYSLRLQWPVFPLKPRGKDPLTPHGFKDATLDEKQIAEWWKKWPRANIGTPTGVKFWVADIDPRNGGDETLRILVHRHSRLPDTISQVTGGGGQHLLFSLPDGPLSSGQLGDGIDIKAQGGYIVIAPSIHPSGRAYTWDGTEPIIKQKLLPAPAWLLEEIAAARGRDQSPVEMPEVIKKGKQHQTLFRLGASMRAKGCSEAEIFAMLWEANQHRCEEPGPEENIHKLANSICAQYDAGSNAKKNGKPPAGAAAQLVRQESLVIYHADYPEPEPIVDAILYPGLTILGGRPKVGKSWFALSLAVSVVSGQRLGQYLEVKKPGRVLYVSLEEQPRQTRSRLRVLTQPSDYLADLHYVYKLPPLMAGGAALLDKELTEHPVELLVVDSLLAITQQASRRGVDIMQADYNIVNTLRELAEKHRMALVLVAHTRKAPGEFLDAIQGTSGTTAAADAIWVLARGTDGEVTLSVTGRDLPTNLFGLRREDDSPIWKIVGEGEEVEQGQSRREIIELLRDQGPMKPTTIARAVHKNVGSVQRLLGRLLETGLIVRTHYGTYQVPGGSSGKSCESGESE